MGLGMMLSDVSSALNAAFLEGYLALPLLTVIATYLVSTAMSARHHKPSPSQISKTCVGKASGDALRMQATHRADARNES
jgi:hypothetical protein